MEESLRDGEEEGEGREEEGLDLVTLHIQVQSHMSRSTSYNLKNISTF